jgi:hypothetical protein
VASDSSFAFSRLANRQNRPNDLTVKRLANSPAYVLSAKDLTSAVASLRKGAANKSLTASGEKVRPKRTRR